MASRRVTLGESSSRCMFGEQLFVGGDGFFFLVSCQRDGSASKHPMAIPLVGGVGDGVYFFFDPWGVLRFLRGLNTNSER